MDGADQVPPVMWITFPEASTAMQNVAVGHDSASRPPLASTTRGVDQPVPGVRTESDDPRTAMHVPGVGQDTAESPAVPAGHGPEPVDHAVPFQSTAVPPTRAEQCDASAQPMPTFPV